MSVASMALPELGALHEYEYEGAAPVWRGAYGLGEGESEAFLESMAEYAVGGGGRGAAGHPAGVAARAALATGVPLGVIGISSNNGTYVDGETGLVRVSPLMVVEHFGHAMAEAESETEAEAFLPLLLPLAAKALPFVAKAVLPRLGSAVARVAPRLLRSAGQVVRTLRRNPATRRLVRAVPTIVRRTMADVARDVQRGQTITPQRAVNLLATETQRVLGNPTTCAHTLRRAQALDRRYHFVCRQIPSR
jgi:hypothetical protein